MSRPVVLVVDDEDLVRAVAVEALQEEGFHVLEARDASEALSLIGSEPSIALLFTDVSMPGAMDGFQLVAEAVALRPGLRAIVTSGVPGYAGEPHLTEGVPFLEKPYLPDVLTAVTLAQLDLRDLQRDGQAGAMEM